jgi:peptidoglycan/xylan/chitin deacetylase (PgdA/CDA1 family)
LLCHGWRWINYQTVDEATDSEHMRLGLSATEQLTGTPAGLVHRATNYAPADWWLMTAAWA